MSIALLCWIAIAQEPIDSTPSLATDGCDCTPSLVAVESVAPWSLQLLGGYHTLINSRGARMGFYPNGVWGKWLNFDYPIGVVRVGLPPGSAWFSGTPLKGNGSLLFEYVAATITDGFGSYLTGPSVLMRYTFLPDAALQPYLQTGLGGVFTDADRDPNQRLIGGDFEFLLHLDAGLQCRLNECWSLDAEIGLHHISNGGLRSRNVGANTIGAAVGVTYRFGK